MPYYSSAVELFSCRISSTSTSTYYIRVIGSRYYQGSEYLGSITVQLSWEHPNKPQRSPESWIPVSARDFAAQQLWLPGKLRGRTAGRAGFVYFGAH